VAKAIRLETNGFNIFPVDEKDIPVFSHCTQESEACGKDKFYKSKMDKILKLHGFDHVIINGEFYKGG